MSASKKAASEILWRSYMNNLRITIAELAKLCGVSPGTVDRALNDRGEIKAETKEKILRTAAQYGFRDVMGNSKCGDTRLKQIGVIVFNLFNEYFSKLVMEIESACREIGYATIVMFTNYDKQHEIENIRRMYSLGVEGIILCAVNSGSEFENYLKAFDIPVVAVGNDVGAVPYVGIDDFEAMKTVTEYVLQSGYKNIIYFSPAMQYEGASAQKRRFEGFITAIPRQLAYSVIADIEKIQEIYPEDTAIICSTDYYALKVYFKTKGAKIFGFDNIDILDEYKVSVTSLDYSVEEIGREAVHMIAEGRAEGKKVAYQIVER